MNICKIEIALRELKDNPQLPKTVCPGCGKLVERVGEIIYVPDCPYGSVDNPLPPLINPRMLDKNP